MDQLTTAPDTDTPPEKLCAYCLEPFDRRPDETPARFLERKHCCEDHERKHYSEKFSDGRIKRSKSGTKNIKDFDQYFYRLSEMRKKLREKEGPIPAHKANRWRWNR